MRSILTALIILVFSVPVISQEVIWTNQQGSGGSESAGYLDKTPNGDIIVGQSFSSIISVGDSIYTPQGVAFYLAKMNQEGEYLWSEMFEGNGLNNIRDVAVNQTNGNIAVTGSMTFNLSIGSVQLLAPSGTTRQTFLIVLDSFGIPLWGEIFKGGSNTGSNVEFDPFGSIYLTGMFEDSIAIDTSQHFEHVPAGNSNTPYITKFSASGAHQWSKAFPTSGYVFIQAGNGFEVPLTFLANGDPVIALNYTGEIVVENDTLGPTGFNSYDFAFVGLSGSGQALWSYVQSGPGIETCNDLHADANDNFWAVGELQSGAVLNGQVQTSLPSRTMFLAQFNTSGTLLHLTHSSTSNSRGGYLDMDAAGDIYVTGSYFFGNVNLGGLTLPPSQSTRGFIAKYSPLSSTWDWIQQCNISFETSNYHYFSKATVLDIDNVVFTGRFSATINIGGQTLNAAGTSDGFVSRISDCSGLNALISSSTGSQCSASSATLSTSLNGNYSYSWLGNGAVINNSNSNVYNAIALGSYQVIIDSLGCTDTSDVFLLDTASSLSVTLGSFSTLCTSDSPFALSGGLPAGGVYSGPGVSGGVFDPAANGGGNYNITYTYSDSTLGCTDSATAIISVNSAPTVVILPLDTACDNQTSITLNNAFPSGGNYSGTGVSGSTFDASIAGTGTHTIYYTLSNTNCSTTDSTDITVAAAPVVSFTLPDTVCGNASAVAMSATPSGGSFSGTGVSGNFFIPQIVTPGSYLINYSIGQNGCNATLGTTIHVDSLPVADLAALPAVCISDAPFDLSTFANNTMGYFVGTGINGTNFDPNTAGAGTHIIQFIVTNSCGNDTALQSITVHSLPTVTLSALTDLCAQDSPTTLSAGSPAGGIYSGTGVNAGVFDPLIAGVGTHTITYSYMNGNGCTDSATASITVNAMPVVTLDTMGRICENRPVFSLSNGAPTGGIYAGSGISGGDFTASTAGVGFHPITYSFTDINGCTSSDTITAEVRVFFQDTIQHVACDSFTTELGNTYYSSGTYIDSLTTLGDCDSVTVREVTIHYSTLDSVAAENCYNYVSPTNLVYTSTGIYFDTLSTVNGCDSVIRTDLVINDTTFGLITPIACDQFTSPGGSLLTTTGTYFDTLINSNGCDSILTIDLTINPSKLDTIQPIACDIYTSVGGQLLNMSGVYFDSLTTTFGCDSIVRIELTVFNSSLDTVSSSNCESYTSAGGVVYTSSGFFTESYTNVDGCDSIVVEDVEILQVTFASIAPEACDSYTSPAGNSYVVSGAYSDTLANAAGCDSIISINLTIYPSYVDSLFIVSCDSVQFPTNGVWLFASGPYSDTLTSVNGCDSIISADITIHPSASNSVAEVACDSFTSVMGTTYYASTIFSDTFATINGCDSIVEYALTVNSSVSTTVVDTSCVSFTSPSGTLYAISGLYDEVLTTSQGCDSTVTYDLTIQLIDTDSFYVTSCDSFISPSGMVYFIQGDVYESFTNTNGCDSIVGYLITLNYSTTNSVNVNGCDSFVSPSGAVYTASGMFSETLATTAGCDSVVTYNVTIHPSVTETVIATGCDSFASPSGMVYSSSGIFTETLATTNGCDSVVTYDVTLFPSATETVIASGCNSFTSPSGAVYSSSGMFAETLATSNGCDSIVTYDVTIFPTIFSTVVDSACGAYVNPLGTVYSASGSYADTALSSTGCDSIITYVLTIGQPDTTVLNEVSCTAFTSPWGTVYDSTGIYTDTSATSLGCDSVVILNLTVIDVDVSVSVNGGALTANADPNTSTFQWINCTTDLIWLLGETNATFLPTSNVQYAVIVTTESCSDTSDCILFEGVGINDKSSALAIRVFPNPSNGEVNIDFQEQVRNARIEVRNSYGQLISVSKATESNLTSLRINEAAGVYFLRIMVDGRMSEHRIVIQ